jgi:cytochrome c556
VQSERLAKVMDQLSGLRGAFPRGLPDDPESPAGRQAHHALSEAAAVADALAETATRIPAVVQDKAMTPSDRRGFIAEAMRLHDQAIALGDAARANHIEPLQDLLDNVNSTCISCHSRYRDLTGELNTHKASAPSAAPGSVARTRPCNHAPTKTFTYPLTTCSEP